MKSAAAVGCNASLLLAVALAVIQVLWLGNAAAADAESKLKAAYVQKIAEYVDWPEGGRVDDAQTPITLCVIGAPSMVPVFADLASLGQIKQKAISVMDLAPSQSTERCDIAYLGTMSETVALRIVREERKHPMLSFGDTPGYAEMGVLFNFYRRGDQVHFEVNLADALVVGLKISSRLLKLARIVER